MSGERREMNVDVAIAGAGPTGLLLAAELAMRGVQVIVLERNLERPGFVRAFNLNSRSLEILDRRGIVDRFLAEGPKVPFTHFAALDGPLSLASLDTDHPYVLGIPQTRTEALLEAHALECGAEIRWGHEVVDVEQDNNGVTIDLRCGENLSQLHAQWLVGCDGGRSTVRKLAAISFPGTVATRWALLGDVELEDPSSLSYGNHQTVRGSVFAIPRPGYVRVIVSQLTGPADPTSAVTLEEFHDAVAHVLGRHVSFVRPHWLTRFGNAARLAERYRSGRILLAGDAAHVHPPAGAQGLNVGLQDSFNLGWKLAAEIREGASENLLDSYHHERHALGEHLLMQTCAQTELGQTEERMQPVRGLFKSIARNEVVQRQLAEMVTGLDTRYDVADKDAMARWPWLGRLAANVSVIVNDNVTTLAALLRSGRHVLVTSQTPAEIDAQISGWKERLSMASFARGEPTREWTSDVDAALIRPDGHLAWLATSHSDVATLPVALERWLGPARRY
jgi:2-polyprenyl-6-methoxyphenol hydroxylase-like FAD-dependent oxidoreductase